MKPAEKLFDACDPFARAASIIGGLPGSSPSDDTPLIEVLPGIWPTVGDLRGVLQAMKALGWTNNYARRHS